MSPFRVLFLSAVLAASAGAAISQTAPSTPATAPAEKAPKRLPGYLGPDGVPDAFKFLPPPPADNSLAEQRDFAVFIETRKLKGSDRWTLAARDAVSEPVAILADFDCALGVTITADNAPALVHLLSRTGADAGAIVNKVKDVYKRPRPFVGNSQPICVERTSDLAKSFSYPSGHATASWALGLILAELAPDKATEVLARARSYGESRVVCGVHFVSDITEGRANGSALIAAEHANPEFRADLAAAKAELDALRKAGGAPGGGLCEVPDEAAAHTPWKG